VEVSHDEGVANCIGTESCACVRKGAGEALTGGVRAGTSSRENNIIQGADALNICGRQYGLLRYREWQSDPAWSKTPSTYTSFSHGNREIL